MILRENLPHATVATVIEDKGKFLLVREHSDSKVVYNQPAGHIESGEGILEAALRETLEETGWEITLTAFIGISVYHAPNGISYIRTTFVGKPLSHHKEQPLDDGIEGIEWLSIEDIRTKVDALRSPMVLRVIEDYLRGKTYSLDMFYEHG